MPFTQPHTSGMPFLAFYCLGIVSSLLPLQMRGLIGIGWEDTASFPCLAASQIRTGEFLPFFSSSFLLGISLE